MTGSDHRTHVLRLSGGARRCGLLDGASANLISAARPAARLDAVPWTDALLQTNVIAGAAPCGCRGGLETEASVSQVRWIAVRVLLRLTDGGICDDGSL